MNFYETKEYGMFTDTITFFTDNIKLRILNGKEWTLKCGPRDKDFPEILGSHSDYQRVHSFVYILYVFQSDDFKHIEKFWLSEPYKIGETSKLGARLNSYVRQSCSESLPKNSTGIMKLLDLEKHQGEEIFNWKIHLFNVCERRLIESGMKLLAYSDYGHQLRGDFEKW